MLPEDYLCVHIDNASLKTTSYGDIFSLLTYYEVKFEKIISWHGDLLGYEILLDFDFARRKGLLENYKKGILDMSVIQYTLSRLANSSVVFNPQRLFVNMERSHLCNPHLLHKVVLVSRQLFLNNVELVLEITESNPCLNCPRISKGLLFLKREGVSLAVDDYNIYDGDFRAPEVLAGIYDYIKIEMPINEREQRCFNLFSLQLEPLCRKIILERVECIEDVKTLVRPFGLQGYFNS